MSMKSFVMALAMLAGSTAAFGQQGTMQGSGAALTETATLEQEQAPASAGRTETGERRICRRIENTQSRMNRRQVCLTAREWRERQN